MSTPNTTLKVASAVQSHRHFLDALVMDMTSKVRLTSLTTDFTPYVVKKAVYVPDVRSLLQPLQSRPIFGGNAQGKLQQAGWLSRPTPPGADGKSVKLPGSPGHAATNVIDRNGGLDPTGRTVDGNNAAGVSKQMGSIG